jgi:hypothetical protein
MGRRRPRHERGSHRRALHPQNRRPPVRALSTILRTMPNDRSGHGGRTEILDAYLDAIDGARSCNLSREPVLQLTPDRPGRPRRARPAAGPGADRRPSTRTPTSPPIAPGRMPGSPSIDCSTTRGPAYSRCGPQRQSLRAPGRAEIKQSSSTARSRSSTTPGRRYAPRIWMVRPSMRTVTISRGGRAAALCRLPELRRQTSRCWTASTASGPPASRHRSADDCGHGTSAWPKGALAQRPAGGWLSLWRAHAADNVRRLAAGGQPPPTGPRFRTTHANPRAQLRGSASTSRRPGSICVRPIVARCALERRLGQEDVSRARTPMALIVPRARALRSR